VAPLERALTLRQDGAPVERAETELVLAQALGVQSPRTAQLSGDARKLLTPLAERWGAQYRRLLNEISQE
jgi:hypothetical protein